MTFILSLLTGKLVPLIGGALALVLAFFGMRFKFIRQGRGIEKAKQAAATKHNLDTRDEIEEAISGRADDENRKGLKQWSRKQKRSQ